MSVVNIATNRDNPQQQHGFFTMQLTSPMGFRFFSAFGWSSWHMPPRNTMAQRRFAGEHVERFTRRRGGGTGCARATEVAQGRSEATGRVRYLHRDRDHVADLLLPASETSRPHMSRYFLGEDPPKVRVFRRRPRVYLGPTPKHATCRRPVDSTSRSRNPEGNATQTAARQTPWFARGTQTRSSRTNTDGNTLAQRHKRVNQSTVYIKSCVRVWSGPPGRGEREQQR
jgi:hypothetical protein